MSGRSFALSPGRFFGQYISREAGLDPLHALGDLPMQTRAVLLAVAISAQILLSSAVWAAGVGQTCGGIIGVGCDTGLFCETPAGKCAIADGQGRCVKIPAACNKTFRPVCGCDSKTYGNDCERQAGQVSKSHNGKCS